MKIPVIIPAFEAEKTLSAVLRSLPAELCEPIVAFNGKTSTEAAAITDNYGVTHYQFAEQGKLPAIQKTLRRLGDAALQPLVILDADTVPLSPRRWVRHMTAALRPEEDMPASAAGPVIFHGRDIPTVCARTIRRSIQGLVSQDVRWYGPNMSIFLRDRATLGAVLSLGHKWPGEDKAIADTIIENGGRHRETPHPNALALTPLTPTMPSVWLWVSKGGLVARQAMIEDYRRRAAPGSHSYL